jgi:hypothetical protein
VIFFGRSISIFMDDIRKYHFIFFNSLYKPCCSSFIMVTIFCRFDSAKSSINYLARSNCSFSRRISNDDHWNVINYKKTYILLLPLVLFWHMVWFRNHGCLVCGGFGFHPVSDLGIILEKTIFR